MLESLLPKTRRDILALLFGRSEESFYLREIVRVTGDGRGAVERELRALAQAGIVTREKRGNLAFFRANRESPLFPEIRGLMLKTAGLKDVVREALVQVQGVQLAFIFGSVAKGTADSRSDVDVLIVADAAFADIASALLVAQQRLGRDISPTVYSPAEFAEKLAEKHYFLTAVLQQPKIALIGSIDEIGRVGEPTQG